MADTGLVEQTRLQQLIERVIGRSPLTRAPMNTMGETPQLTEEPHFPQVSWTRARYNKQQQCKFPQAIAHRGYKAVYPENTMAAFKGAVEVGVHAIETDIHLTKDGVVVLSHDATLTRCFGRPEKLVDLDWKELKDLKTTAEPKQHMPCLSDLLEYLASPGLEDLWVLLDIKLDNDTNEVMSRIASTISSTTPSEQKAWKDRIVLGIWATKCIPLCSKHLPGFPVTHIGFNTSYASQFLRVPNISFNMLQVTLIGPFGARFLRKARQAQREMFGWTVNDERNMRWSIKRNLDGVISDDPKKFLAICNNWQVEKNQPTWAIRQLLNLLRFNFLALIFSIMFRVKFGSGLRVQSAKSKDRA